MPHRGVAILPSDCSFETFVRHWKCSHAVLLRAPRHNTRRGSSSRASVSDPAAVLAVMKPHCCALEASYTSESTSAGRSTSTGSLAALLGRRGLPPGTWYSSWISHQPETLMRRVYAVLPCAHPPCLGGPAVTHERAVWWFVGRNASTCSNLPGRPEHTDHVVHEGTWHYQLAGAKEWTLRPTQELIAACFGGRSSGPVKVLCEAGDILVVSTREWWHSTLIPPLDGGLSVSYAREFNICGSPGESAGRKRAADEIDDTPATFINVDGLFATAAIAAGAVIMTEDEPGMADAELPTSTNPNCLVVEDEDTGTMCLVAARDIPSGEFLSIAA